MLILEHFSESFQRDPFARQNKIYNYTSYERQSLEIDFVYTKWVSNVLIFNSLSSYDIFDVPTPTYRLVEIPSGSGQLLFLSVWSRKSPVKLNIFTFSFFLFYTSWSNACNFGYFDGSHLRSDWPPRSRSLSGASHVPISIFFSVSANRKPINIPTRYGLNQNYD